MELASRQTAVPRKTLLALASIGALACTCLLAAAFAAPAHAATSHIQVGNGPAYVYSSSHAIETVPGVSYNDATKTLTLNNANIVQNDKTYGSGIDILANAADTINVNIVGDNSVSGSAYGINANCALKFSGPGKLNVRGDHGIYAGDKLTFAMTGDVNASGATSYRYAIRGKGIAITAGKVSASGYYALNPGSGKVSNAPARLGTIKGLLGDGARFKTGGSEYQVSQYGYVTLLKAAAKKTWKVDKVGFGGESYRTSAIAANAFKNMKKLKKLSIGGSVKKIGKTAFAGTKGLTKLDLSDAYSLYTSKFNSKGGYSTFKVASGVNKKAFSKAGKGGGKKLVVKTGWYAKKSIASFKSAFVKKGLSKKTKATR